MYGLCGPCAASRGGVKVAWGWYHRPVADENTPAEAYKRLVPAGLMRRLMELCRDEDLGPEQLDITSAVVIERDSRGEAWLVARQGGVVAGLEAIGDVLDVLAPSTLCRPMVADGSRVKAGDRLGALLGSLREILAAERTLLNLLSRLSGVATQTARFVSAVEGTGVSILDTRKTTPGLRVLEKYAVVCGGGASHRMGLHDAVLVKDNHLAGLSPKQAADRVRQASERARERYTPAFVEVEVDTLDQLDALLELEPGVVDVVLLDNMNAADMRSAVERRARGRTRPLLEASGGVTIEEVASIAATGVDRIAVGALTHGAVWLDIGLDASAVAAPAKASDAAAGDG